MNWRLLITEPCDGATNMAIDETLWRGRHAGTSPPTVRFFAWDPPTVSIGYGQPLDRHVDVDACRRFGVGLVRRPTGGSAIYHDGPERELTYCVTATADDLGVGADLLETYRWIARALVRGINALGANAEMVPTGRGLGPDPAFCFARTGAFEIEVGGRKLVGSAQRRLGTSFLQHGAVLLGADAARLRALFPTTRDTHHARGRPRESADIRCGRRCACARVRGRARTDAGAGRADGGRERARGDTGRRALWARDVPRCARAPIGPSREP